MKHNNKIKEIVLFCSELPFVQTLHDLQTLVLQPLILAMNFNPKYSGAGFGYSTIRKFASVLHFCVFFCFFFVAAFFLRVSGIYMLLPIYIFVFAAGF